MIISYIYITLWMIIGIAILIFDGNEAGGAYMLSGLLYMLYSDSVIKQLKKRLEEKTT